MNNSKLWYKIVMQNGRISSAGGEGVVDGDHNVVVAL
jgi:hypothetical protein